MDTDQAVSQYELLQEKWANFLTRFHAPLLNAGVSAHQLDNTTLHDALVACTFVAPYTSTIAAAATGDFQALQTLITAGATILGVDRTRLENAWAALPAQCIDTAGPSKHMFWRYVRFFLDSVNTTRQ